MKKLTLSVALMASLLVAGVASAEDKSPTASATSPTSVEKKSQRGIIDLPPTEITSPPMRPLAAIAVGRIEPQLTLYVLRQAFVSRIEETIFGDRF